MINLKCSNRRCYDVNLLDFYHLYCLMMSKNLLSNVTNSVCKYHCFRAKRNTYPRHHDDKACPLLPSQTRRRHRAMLGLWNAPSRDQALQIRNCSATDSPGLAVAPAAAGPRHRHNGGRARTPAGVAGAAARSGPGSQSSAAAGESRPQGRWRNSDLPHLLVWHPPGRRGGLSHGVTARARGDGADLKSSCLRTAAGGTRP